MAGIYATAGIDSKANLEVGRSYDAVAHRFTSTGGTVISVRWSQRFGPGGYSGGTCGIIKVSIQASAGGIPSGTVLGSGTFTPTAADCALNDSRFYDIPISTTAIAAGTYFVVWQNLDAAPTLNWQSVNEVLDFAGAAQPIDAAVFTKRLGAWTRQSSYLGVTDVTYSDGHHDGAAYIEVMRAFVGYVGGTSAVREHFTPVIPHTITTVGVRLIRISGSDPLTVSLAGHTVTIPAASIPLGTVAGNSTGAWVSVPLSATLAAGTTYDLKWSAPSTSQYAESPVREGTDTGCCGSAGSPTGFRSYRFTDGGGEKTTDGTNWAPFYAYSPVDLQFYLR